MALSCRRFLAICYCFSSSLRFPGGRYRHFSYLNCTRCSFLKWLAGNRPAATHFVLLRQNKVSKEKATLLSASRSDATGNLRCSVQPGSAQTRLRLKQRAALIRLAFRSSAQTEGLERMRDRNPNCTLSPPVLAGPVMTGKNGIRAARCLSEASLRGPPLFPGSAGCPKRSEGTQTAGRLFFAYFLLAKEKTSESPAGRDRPASPGKTKRQISILLPSSTTALLGKFKKSAAPLALWCICANSFSRQSAMPLPIVGTTVSRERK